MKGEQDLVCRDFRPAGQVSAGKGEGSSLFRAAVWGSMTLNGVCISFSTLRLRFSGFQMETTKRGYPEAPVHTFLTDAFPGLCLPD